MMLREHLIPIVTILLPLQAILVHAVPIESNGGHNAEKPQLFEKSTQTDRHGERPQIIDNHAPPKSSDHNQSKSQLRPESEINHRTVGERPQIIYIRNHVSPPQATPLPHVDAVHRRYRFDDIPNFRQGQWWNERKQINEAFEKLSTSTQSPQNEISQIKPFQNQIMKTQDKRQTEQTGSEVVERDTKPSDSKVMTTRQPYPKPSDMNVAHGRPQIATPSPPACTYKGEKYAHGDQVSTPEPCLNCTCQRGVLVCFLRVCPAVTTIPPGCFTAKEAGQCCPSLICSAGDNSTMFEPTTTTSPDDDNYYDDEEASQQNDINSQAGVDTHLVSEDQVTIINEVDNPYDDLKKKSRLDNENSTMESPVFVSSTTESPMEDVQQTEARPVKVTTGACWNDGSVYREGSAMLSNKECVYCYCIRGVKKCVKPRCAMRIEGCLPRYSSKYDCCPSHYYCEAYDNSTTTTTTTQATTMEGCDIDGVRYSLGQVLPSKQKCEVCYCTPKGPMCSPVECPIAAPGCVGVTPPGHCCPTEYVCDTIRNTKNEVELLKIIPDPNPGSYKETHVLRKIDNEELHEIKNDTDTNGKTDNEISREEKTFAHPKVQTQSSQESTKPVRLLPSEVALNTGKSTTESPELKEWNVTSSKVNVDTTTEGVDTNGTTNLRFQYSPQVVLDANMMRDRNNQRSSDVVPSMEQRTDANGNTVDKNDSTGSTSNDETLVNQEEVDVVTSTRKSTEETTKAPEHEINKTFAIVKKNNHAMLNLDFMGLRTKGNSVEASSPTPVYIGEDQVSRDDVRLSSEEPSGENSSDSTEAPRSDEERHRLSIDNEDNIFSTTAASTSVETNDYTEYSSTTSAYSEDLASSEGENFSSTESYENGLLPEASTISATIVKAPSRVQEHTKELPKLNPSSLATPEDLDTKLSKASNNKKSTFTVNLGSHITVAYDPAEVTTEGGITTLKDLDFSKIFLSTQKSLPTTPATAEPSIYVKTLSGDNSIGSTPFTTKEASRATPTIATTTPSVPTKISPSGMFHGVTELVTSPSTQPGVKARPDGTTVRDDTETTTPTNIITTSDVINNVDPLPPTFKPEEDYTTERTTTSTIRTAVPSGYRAVDGSGHRNQLFSASKKGASSTSATTPTSKDTTTTAPTEKPKTGIDLAEGVKLFSTLLLTGLATSRKETPRPTFAPTTPASAATTEASTIVSRPLSYSNHGLQVPHHHRPHHPPTIYSSPIPIPVTLNPRDTPSSHTTRLSYYVDEPSVTNVPYINYASLNHKAHEQADRQPTAAPPKKHEAPVRSRTTPKPHKTTTASSKSQQSHRVVPFLTEDAMFRPIVPSHVKTSQKKKTSPVVIESGKAACFINGVNYADGETIPKDDTCMLCKCYFGEELCSIKTCPQPPGTQCIAERIPGKCCSRYICRTDSITLPPPSTTAPRHSHHQDGFHKQDHPKYVPHYDILMAPVDPQIRTVKKPSSLKVKATSPPRVKATPPPTQFISIEELQRLNQRKKITGSRLTPSASHNPYFPGPQSDTPPPRPTPSITDVPQTTTPLSTTQYITTSEHTKRTTRAREPETTTTAYTEPTTEAEQMTTIPTTTLRALLEQVASQTVVTEASTSTTPSTTTAASSGGIFPSFSDIPFLRSLFRSKKPSPVPEMSRESTGGSSSIETNQIIHPKPEPAAYSAPLTTEATYTYRTPPHAQRLENVSSKPTSTGGSIWNLLKISGCNIYGKFYRVNEVVTELTDRCKVCNCSSIGVHCIQTC